MSERFGGPKRDARALDRYITREQPDDDEITDGMLRWEPGSLSTTIIERIATDALADLWRDCYRRGDNLQAFQRELFRQRVSDLIAAAAGEPFEVIKCPRIPKYPPRGDAA